MSNDKHTPTPWSYRPHRHDDWGFIRDSEGDLVAVSKNSKISFSEHDGFRSRKEDPYEPNGKRIVQCVNACEGLDDPERYFRQMTESGVLALWNDFESLRAEKAELIEALKRFRNYLVDNNDVLPPFPNRSEIDNIEETLAKIETK